MRALPVRPDRYPAGVALFGVLFACGLVLSAVSLGFVWVVVANERARLAAHVASLGGVLMCGGATALAWTCLSYQARPSPRPPVGPGLVWRLTGAARAELALALVGVTMAGVSVATVGGMQFALAGIVSVALRHQTARRASRGRRLGNPVDESVDDCPHPLERRGIAGASWNVGIDPEDRGDHPPRP
jgi:hypothetical protein